MTELEAGPQQAGWDHAPTLQDELSLRPQEDRADLEHPACRRQTDASAPCIPQSAHELSIRERVRGSHIDSACEIVVLDQPTDGTREVLIVHPGDVLASVTRLAAEPATDETEQNVEDAPAVGAHDHRRPHGDLSRPRRRGSGKFPFPRASDVDAETPRVRHVWLVAAEDATMLVVRRVVTMRIDRRRAGLQPDARRICAFCDRSAHYRGRRDARLHDRPPVRRVVPAVHAAAREVDHCTRTLQISRPRPEGLAVPIRLLLPRVPAKDDYLMTGSGQGAAQDRPDLARATCDHDLQAEPRMDRGLPTLASHTGAGDGYGSRKRRSPSSSAYAGGRPAREAEKEEDDAGRAEHEREVGESKTPIEPCICRKCGGHSPPTPGGAS